MDEVDFVSDMCDSAVEVELVVGAVVFGHDVVLRLVFGNVRYGCFGDGKEWKLLFGYGEEVGSQY